MPASPKPFSMRLRAPTMERLESHSRLRGESKSRVAEQLIEEGLRMQDHPQIVFRDGPAGRRAALAVGPDVWEVIGTIRSSGKKGEEAERVAAEWGALAPTDVRAAVAYYAEYPDEIDERIRLNQEMADREYAAWQRAQAALA